MLKILLEENLIQLEENVEISRNKNRNRQRDMFPRFGSRYIELTTSTVIMRQRRLIKRFSLSIQNDQRRAGGSY